MRLGAPDASGRPRPEPIPGAFSEIAVDRVIGAVGEDVDRSILPSTFRPGALWDASDQLPVFLGGDLAGLRRTVADAIGSGRMTATWIDRWLTLREPPVTPSTPPQGGVPIEGMRLDWFEPAERVRRPEREVALRVTDFQEVIQGLSEGHALAEARRCLSCGLCTGCDRCWLVCPDVSILVENLTYRVDLAHCKGCLLCVAECPRGAIVTEGVASRGLPSRKS
jgi:ferredoxin